MTPPDGTAISTELKEFCRALTNGPSFLFLGQSYLSLETGKDAFLTETLQKYRSKKENGRNYNLIFETEIGQSVEDSLAWLHELSNRITAPSWLKTVAKFAWSGVYTSSIDFVWPRYFRSNRRELYHVLEEKNNPSDPRNRAVLHCTYLFGNVSRAEKAERPPLTNRDMLRRSPIAISLAGRLPEAITPIGTLVIEGYMGDEDWFTPKYLFPIIDSLNAGQAHMFSVTKEIKRNQTINDLVDSGKLVLHESSLASFMLKGEEIGLIKSGEDQIEQDFSHRIQLDDTSLEVPLGLWNLVSKSATILDETTMLVPPTISSEKVYQEFRNFLAESSIRPIWSGYARGFAFERDFETRLSSLVHESLKSKTLQSDPIILHGQTGTGKTVALGHLSYLVKKEGKHPVIFIERRNRSPSGSDIDTFCKWAEDSGFQSTLIVWDGMLDNRNVEQYTDLLKFLVGRGRKVVLVGSSYKLDSTKYGDKNLLEAPSVLSENEVNRFLQFIAKFDSSVSDFLAHNKQSIDESFLVALYRLLPPTRGMIRSGVRQEMDLATKRIGESLQKSGQPQPNTLGLALLDAGVITKEELISSGTEKDYVSSFLGDELVGMIMVPGRFGLKVPLELLLRPTGKDGFLEFARLIGEIDLFRIDEDNDGNMTVAPRHTLEARLLTQAKLGGIRAEVSFVNLLISKVRGTSGAAHDPELQFTTSLIHNIGPNGQDSTRFQNYYLDIAKTLRTLRVEGGVVDPGLMLQEASLLREYVVQKSKVGTPPDASEEILNDGKRILLSALEISSKGRRNDKLRAMILVELASTIGSNAVHLLHNSEYPDKSIPLFREAQTYLFEARRLDPSSYYPIDVLLWTTSEIIKNKVLDPQAEAEAKADLLHIVEMTEAEDFGTKQQERYLIRQMQVGNILNKENLSDEAFTALEKRGSVAGYYLRASDILKNVRKNVELNTDEREACRKAVDYLTLNLDNIKKDQRCMYLLLHTWWKMKTGKPMFYRERQTLPFSFEEWQYAFTLVVDLMSLEGNTSSPSLKYLQGLCLFHLGAGIDEALGVFRELERESDHITGRRRIIRSYIASTEEGHPRTFNGSVAWISGDGARGEIYVEELRRNIKFIPLDLHRPDLSEHETISDFHIAFNFLGPVIDPPNYFKRV